MLQRGLVISEKALGVEHPEVDASYSNLGMLYRIMGKLEESLKMVQRGLERDSRVTTQRKDTSPAPCFN